MLHIFAFETMESLVGHQCVTCGKTFYSVSNLYRHARLTHGTGDRPLGIRRFKCVLCKADLATKNLLELHFTESHALDIKKEVIEFDLFDDFLQWKKIIEKNDICSYVKTSSTKERKEGLKVSHFYCHRSGNFKSQSCGKRSLLGSYKMNALCPAKLKVVEDTNVGKIKVEFTKTHVGHSQDIRHICKKYSRGKVRQFQKEDMNDNMFVCEDEKKNEKESHVSCLTGNKSDIKKEKFIAEIKKIFNDIISISDTIPTSECARLLQLLRNTCNEFRTCSSSGTGFPSTCSEPPNKKIKTQRFVSTKKKSRPQKTNNILHLLSEDETEESVATLFLQSSYANEAEGDKEICL